MDTTPGADFTEPPAQPDPHRAELEELADMDPADAPEAAERLAAELAHDLEGIGTEDEPTQLAAPFPSEEEAP